MKTPICDFVEKYVAENALRLHMPGHKGKGALQASDVTEIEGADVLYHATGIIAESQQNAAALFDTAKTLYSCEGSSLAIRAMLYLARLWAAEEGRPPRVLAGRNVHKTFVSAAALLDLEIEWLWGESLLSCTPTPELLATEIDRSSPAAVYITSPDYLGNRADIKALAAVCRAKNVLLLVDNAHGAYLHFLPESAHPIALGAHLCCDSAHKTLPVLTGGAYLHVGKNTPEILLSQAENAMALFASTSPSYLILQSLDRCNAHLAGEYRECLAAFAPKVAELKKSLVKQGFAVIGDEPLKLTLAPKGYGYRGDEVSAYLRKNDIVCEFADPDHTVMMLSPQQEGALSRLSEVLSHLPRRAPVAEHAPALPRPRRAMSPREAILRPSVLLPVAQCEGRVLGALSVSCPPAVPVAVCGEILDAAAIEAMRYYGIEECYVIQN